MSNLFLDMIMRQQELEISKLISDPFPRAQLFPNNTIFMTFSQT